jgi:hypothetical protein
MTPSHTTTAQLHHERRTRAALSEVVGNVVIAILFMFMFYGFDSSGLNVCATVPSYC